MVKASRRPAVRTVTVSKNRDFVVDRLIKPCQEGEHSKCTGWAVLKKDTSLVNANYFLKCTCACHHKKKEQPQMKQRRIKHQRRQPKKKKMRKKKQKHRVQTRGKKGRKSRRTKNR